MLELQDCLGRIFTKEQLPTELLKIAQRLSSVFEKKGELFCSRCHSQIDKERNLLPIGAYYRKRFLRKIIKIFVTTHSP